MAFDVDLRFAPLLPPAADVSLYLPGRKGSRAHGEIARAERDLAVTHEIPPLFATSTLRPVAPRVDKKVRKREMMALPRCTNVAADKTLACYSLVAEGFVARWLELALR